jgi:hypothetical protein
MPFAAFQTDALNGRYWPVAAFSPFGSLPLPVGSDVFADAAHRAPGIIGHNPRMVSVARPASSG